MIKVLYEDNHVIAVEKPPGVPSMPDKSFDESMLDIVKKYIKEKYSKPGDVYLGLVHRLDRSTGGAMVFARTSKGASRISKQIREKQFKKTYLGVAEGIMAKRSGRMVNHLWKDRKNNKSSVVPHNVNDAKEARLNYKVLSEKPNCSLVEIELETGRHHQIRVQFSNEGNPLWGDVKYGGKHKKGQALWSHIIEFRQPVTGEVIRVISRPDYRIEPWSLFN